MGYANSVVEESLKQQKFDDCYASYLLLGKRNTDVSVKNMYYQVEQTKNLCVVLVSAWQRGEQERKFSVPPGDGPRSWRGERPARALARPHRGQERRHQRPGPQGRAAEHQCHQQQQAQEGQHGWGSERGADQR